MKPPRFVLASASPRRSALLSQLGIEHTIDVAAIDELVRAGESPEVHVERLAVAKAREVSHRHADAVVIGGDTVVVLGERILGKPASPVEAEEMLLALAGRTHRVVSGLALVVPGRDAPTVYSRVDHTSVTFGSFGADTARAYVATGEPMDKAGAYGIQGGGAALVSRIEGDYTTVVGLSIAGLVQLLHDAGWRYHFAHLEPRN